MCQVAACMVPKFKLNWTVEDNPNDYNSQENLQSTCNTTSTECHNSDFEDNFFSFEENNVLYSNNDYKLLVNNYLSNTNIKSPSELPNIFKEIYIKYNTAVPSSALVKRLYNARSHLLNKRRRSIADQSF